MAVISKIKVGGTTYNVGIPIMSEDKQLEAQDLFDYGYSGPVLAFSGMDNVYYIKKGIHS